MRLSAKPYWVFAAGHFMGGVDTEKEARNLATVLTRLGYTRARVLKPDAPIKCRDIHSRAILR